MKGAILFVDVSGPNHHHLALTSARLPPSFAQLSNLHFHLQHPIYVLIVVGMMSLLRVEAFRPVTRFEISM
jgi:hypothetical protein